MFLFHQITVSIDEPGLRAIRVERETEVVTENYTKKPITENRTAFIWMFCSVIDFLPVASFY